MSWLTAVVDVRKIISDGATDKLAYRKKVMNLINGVNLTFKTFEFRRVSDFTSPSGPIGVFLNDASVSVTSDDVGSGEFVLSAAPVDGDVLTATYYWQWFLDSELDEFLTDAAEWIGVGSDYTNITEDLRPAAKEFAAHKAYQKLVSKMAVNLAETYQLYDAPDKKRFDPVSMYMKISKDKYDLALKLRDDVYDGRKGQAKAPRSVTISGTVRDVPPNR